MLPTETFEAILGDLLPYPVAFMTFGLIWVYLMIQNLYSQNDTISHKIWGALTDLQPLVDAIIFGMTRNLRNEFKEDGTTRLSN